MLARALLNATDAMSQAMDAKRRVKLDEKEIEPMSRKDYVLIAQTIKDTFHENMDKDHDALTEFAGKLATRLKQKNPKFDTDRFINACFDL